MSVIHAASTDIVHDMDEAMSSGTVPLVAFKEAVASLSRQMTVRCYLRAVGQMDEAFEADIARVLDLQIKQLFESMTLHSFGREEATFASECAQAIVDASDKAIADIKAFTMSSGCVQ
jgi:hypothetical protein